MNNLKFARDKETGLIIPEEWRDIKNYRGEYQISNYGRVKSHKYSSPKVMKLSSRNSVGYVQINLSKDNNKKTHLVHKLVLIHFIREPKEGEESNHIDGNKENNFVDNLEWVTRSENMNHAFSKGLSSNIGETHSKAILTEEDVLEIRKLYSTADFTQKELGDKFGVHQATISDIIHKRSWKQV